MAISTMYPAKAGSPKTTLAENLAADGTSMTLTDASVLPDAPNLAVLGDDSSAEVVSYTSISGNVVSGLVRALGGTVASLWPTGTDVARNFTSFDHNRFIENINDLSTSLSGKASSSHTHAAADIASGKLAVANGGTGVDTAGVNKVFAGPSTGDSTAAPSFRALSANDIPALNASKITAGTLPVARGGTGATTAAANKVFIGPTSGDAAAPTWRVLNAADIPDLSATKITSGKLAIANGGTGASSASANKLLIGPTSGDAAAPTWRKLVADDIPNLSASKITSDTLALARGGTGGTDSGWTSRTNATVFSGTVYYRQVGPFVNVYGSSLTLESDLSSAYIDLLGSGKLPTPNGIIYVPAGNNAGFGQMAILANGSLRFFKESSQSWSASRNIHFCITYMTAS